jgi:hypothetical protein
MAVGYWCAKAPPRGISQHWSPSGLVWTDHLAKGANYTNPEDAVVVAWRGGGRWLTYIWSVDQWVVENSTALFTKGTGNQVRRPDQQSAVLVVYRQDPGA